MDVENIHKLTLKKINYLTKGQGKLNMFAKSQYHVPEPGLDHDHCILECASVWLSWLKCEWVFLQY